MVTAVLLMAGQGSRMNLQKNKVFLSLGDKMIYQYSLDLFLKNGFEVVCVIKEEEKKYLLDYIDKIKIITGGSTRQESVINGISVASGDYVLIHDAARPFINQELIDECLLSIEKEECLLVAKESKDSVYSKQPFSSINRDNIYLAQTPQGAPKELLIDCHKKAQVDGYQATDDISLVLKYSNKEVNIIKGTENNFKITTQLDYVIAKELIKNV